MPLITKVLDPARFNANECARIYYQRQCAWAEHFPDAKKLDWQNMPENQRRIFLDLMEGMLDQMVAEGIVGE